MNREQRVDEIERAIGDRILVWFGIRGEDAASLLAVRQFRACFSVTAPLVATSLDAIDSIEARTKLRVDLDAYDIDFDDRPEISDFRRSLLTWANHPSVLTTYRPSHLLSSIQFASARTATYLGLFKDRQIAFEHKPWVESELAAAGVSVVPWRYVSDDNRLVARQMLKEGPVVLRASRRSGGAGISLVLTDEKLDELWPDQGDHFVAVAPFLADAIPVNVGACVYADGVAVHPGSVQIIGHPACTDRVFGFCGNDFGSFAQFSERVVMEIDAMVRAIGDWLRSMGYLGAFGVDFLVDESGPKFCEINARFQGSTAISSELARSVDRSDILIDHIAAFLGLPAPPLHTLADWASEVRPTAQVIVHNLRAQPLFRQTGFWSTPRFKPELLPPQGIGVEPGGVIFRLRSDEAVTRTGFDLPSTVTGAIESGLANFAIWEKGGYEHR